MKIQDIFKYKLTNTKNENQFKKFKIAIFYYFIFLKKLFKIYFFVIKNSFLTNLLVSQNKFPLLISTSFSEFLVFQNKINFSIYFELYYFVILNIITINVFI